MMPEIENLVREDLARSGLVPEDIHGLKIVGLEAMKPLPATALPTPEADEDEGYDPDDFDEDEDETADPSEGFEAVGGYLIPYFTLYGKPIREGKRKFSRVRLVGRKNDSVPRYRSPKGSNNHVFIPQGLRDLLVRIARQRDIVPGVDILYITEGEKKAVRAVKSGIICIALPGVTMWADSEKRRAMKAEYEKLGGNPKDVRLNKDTPISPELLQAIKEIVALCPSIGVICPLFDSDGLPVPEKDAFKKTKDGREPVGGVNWRRWIKPRHDKKQGAPTKETEIKYYSANPMVTNAAYTLAEALRAQMMTRAVVAPRFCKWDDRGSEWKKQGLDDWLQASRSPDEVVDHLMNSLNSAVNLWAIIKDERLFGANNVDPDEIGTKSGPSAEMAFSRMLDGNIVGQADGLLYEWVGSHWQAIETERAGKAAHRLVNAFYASGGSARKIGDAPKAAVFANHLFQIPKPDEGSEDAGCTIPCLDVTLDVSKKGDILAREPRKEDGLRYCVNAKWADRNQPCPEFDRFIRDTLPDPDVRRLVQQYVGYTLISDTRFQVAQWWFGSGANGKGFLARIVAALHRKVAASNIEDLSGFGSENLIDASLITVDETPKRIDEQRLKTAISGDALSINRKYLPSVTVQLRGKWLLRGNDKPALSDQTDGLWRRLQIIEFTQKFEGDKRDDGLADRIIKNELPGVLRWAVDGLVMLLKAGGFKDIPESVQASKTQMQIETDNVLGWWTENDVRVCDAPRAKKDSVYTSYSVWCKSNGMMPLGSVGFWRRVRSIVDKLGLKLVETKPREQINNPIEGTARTRRVLKCNIDIYGDDDEAATDSNVIPFVPPVAPVASPEPQARVAPTEAMDTVFPGLADLEPEEFIDIPF